MKTTRRQFLKIGAVVGAGALLPLSAWRAFASVTVPQTPLPGASIPQFVEPLTTFVGRRVTSTGFGVSMREFHQKILPDNLYSTLAPPFNQGTYVWGYKVDSRPAFYPGFTVEARQGAPTFITYSNDLPLPGKGQLEPLLTIDQTIHWAAPHGMSMDATQPYQGTIPTVVHLHGAEVPSLFDGAPEAWFTQDGIHGKGYSTFAPTSGNAAIYRYPNTQPATTLWFHDHALGLTRINVFSGLAAFYFVRDQFDTGFSDNPLRLPAGSEEIELIIQDRQFDTNGQLLFPDGSPASNPTGLNGPPPNPGVHPFWIPEFFGDAIVVNGRTWPYLNVEPRRYRFRFLNASNARFLRMNLIDSSSQAPGPAFWQIGTDGGLLDRPAMLNNPNDHSPLQLFLAPSERADVIIDFSGLAGRSFTLVNDAPFPFPGGGAPDPAVDGRVMQFRVNLPLSSPDRTYDPSSGLPLRGGAHQPPAIVRLANPATGTLAAGVRPLVKRQLVLVEVEGPGGPIEVLVNNSKWKGVHEGTNTPIPGSQPDQMGQGIFLTELPKVGSTEEWEIINLTEDAHPIHIHLIQFQLINRQNFDVDNYRPSYDSQFPGGTFAGLLPDGTWGTVDYAPGVYIPGYGPPLSYNQPNADGAVGGNPAVSHFLQGGLILPDVNEAGWKDTVKMYPGLVTRIVIRWAPIATLVNGVQPGQNLYSFDPTVGPGYVWHCHILDHEDNEMMRPYAPVWSQVLNDSPLQRFAERLNQMRDLRHESLFTRPLTTYPTCRRSGHTPHRGSCPVPGLAVHRQAVSEATPPNRSVAINPIPGRPAKYGAALDAGLPAQLVAHADVTPEDYCQLWEQTHGQRVSTATMSRAIARLGWRPSRRAWKPSPCRMRRSVFGIADTQPALPWLADDTPCDLGLYASVPQLGRYLHQKTG